MAMTRTRQHFTQPKPLLWDCFMSCHGLVYETKASGGYAFTIYKDKGGMFQYCITNKKLHIKWDSGTDRQFPVPCESIREAKAAAERRFTEAVK